MGNKLLVLGVSLFLMVLLVTAMPGNKNTIKLQVFEKKFSVSDGGYVLDEIIVKFKPGTSSKIISKLNSGQGAFIRHGSPYAKFRRIKIPRGKTVSEMVEVYREDPNVEYAEPNYIAHALMVPNDPYYGLQWHLDNAEYGGIGMEEAWDSSTGSGVTVAIVDTGIAYEDYQVSWFERYYKAPDLADTCFVAGYDFVNDDTHPNDDSSPGHGTHVAGTVAQSTDNNLGVAGVAFNACLMPVKVLGSGGSGTYADVAEGIIWAADHGAQVISLSLGGNSPSTTLENAVAYAYNKGVTVIAAAGNEGSGTISYPAAYDDYVIAVGATQYDETRAPYSNYGLSLDLMAPGGNTNLDQNGDGYVDGVLQQTYEKTGWRSISWGYYFMQGTSMATPHVSGVAALLIAKGNAVTPDEVRAALQETADDLGSPGRDDTYGWGLIDAYAALQWASTPNTPPTAGDQSATTDEDATVGITLTATDPENDPLTYSIVSGPSNGALTGTVPSVTYTPDVNYNGGDSFTFKANDGKADSNIAIVLITVNPVNDPPVADDQSVETTQDTAVSITLTASDVDGDSLTYSIIDNPLHGSLSGTASSVTYTPDMGYTGEDSFTFKANDGKEDSNVATASITVTGVNHAPVADDQSVTTDEDTAVDIALIATDPDGDTLVYSVVAGPSHGSLTGTAPDLTYMPELNFNGVDSFTFKVNDAQVDSNIAMVSLTVNPVNDLPVADDQSVTIIQDILVDITLTASDVDGDSLAYSVVSWPSHGSLSSIAPSVTYTPETGYTGTDSFTFRANDGTADSNNIATVSITVNPATQKCWSAEYNYLKRNRDQFKKFCKCAEGNYGYQSYSYARGRKTVYQYTDAGNNENWETKSVSTYYPAYKIRCTDGYWYYTNVDYPV